MYRTRPDEGFAPPKHAPKDPQETPKGPRSPHNAFKTSKLRSDAMRGMVAVGMPVARHPAHFPPHQSHIQRVQRLMRAAARPEIRTKSPGSPPRKFDSKQQTSSRKRFANYGKPKNSPKGTPFPSPSGTSSFSGAKHSTFRPDSVSLSEEEQEG
jgi:hypothetical protein